MNDETNWPQRSERDVSVCSFPVAPFAESHKLSLELSLVEAERGSLRRNNTSANQAQSGDASDPSHCKSRETSYHLQTRMPLPR